MRTLLMIAIVIVARPAVAQDAPGPELAEPDPEQVLELARAADGDGDIPRARALYERALAGGALEPDVLAQVHLRLGALCRAMGEDAAGDAHFAVALAIDPERAPPPDLPPAGRERFEALRGAGRVSLEVSAREADRVEVRARGAPVAALRVRAGSAPADRREGTQTVVELPEGPVDLEVAALDAHGNVLLVHTTTIQGAIAISQTQEAQPVPAPHVPAWWEDGGLWIGAALGVLAIATGVIVTAVIVSENDRLGWTLGSVAVGSTLSLGR